MPNAAHYSEATFADAYKLNPEEARRIIGAVGTAKVDLDVFMLAYRNRALMEETMLDPHSVVATYQF